VQNNAKIMQVVADNADDKAKMITELKKLSVQSPELKINNYIDDLAKTIHSESLYRDTLKKMLVGREASTGTLSQGFGRIAKEHLG
jgi:hypothetical protein